MKLLYVTGVTTWIVHVISGSFTAEKITSMWVNIIQKKVFRRSNRPGSQYDSFTWILSYTPLHVIMHSATFSFSSPFSCFNHRDMSRIREIKTSVAIVGRKTGSFTKVHTYKHRKPQTYIAIQLRTGFEPAIPVFQRSIQEIRHTGCNSFITDILGPSTIDVFIVF